MLKVQKLSQKLIDTKIDFPKTIYSANNLFGAHKFQINGEKSWKLIDFMDAMREYDF